MQVELPDVEMRLTIVDGRPMDDEELFEFCASNRHVRIERDTNGEIVLMPLPGCETSHRGCEVIGQLGAWAKRDGRGVGLTRCGFFLPDGAMRSPHICWVLKSRLANLTKKQKQQFLPLCPDFVVELTSPSDRLSKVKAKMREWIENGASLGWLIDADRRTVYVYRPGKEPEELAGMDRIDGEGPVAGFRLELGDIWEEL